MNMKIIHINNKPYAVGLWWQLHYDATADTPRRDILLAARNMAKDIAEQDFIDTPCNVVALKGPQYGLGIASLENIQGVQSLAASMTLPSPAPQSYIGIFRFLEGWWVCGISNQNIAAEGDYFFESEEAARAHASDLAEIFGEKEEVLCATQEKSEQYLVPLLTTGVAVEPLNPSITSSRLIRNVAIGIAIILVLFGLKWAWDTMASEAARHDSRQLMQSKAEREQAIAANVHRYFPNKWLDAPSVNTMHNTCMPKFFDVPLFIDGWAMTAAVCTQKSLDVNWQHDQMASYVALPPQAQLTGPKKAVSHFNISSEMLPRHLDSELLKKNEVGLYLYEITRQLSCKLTSISWKTTLSKTIQGVKITSPWIEGQWALEAIPDAFVYGVVFDLLGQIPALTITEISYTNGHWAMKGNVYVCR